MWREFRDFITRGNVLDLAVGVIIGAAFGKIVTSLTDDILMPLIGLITGGIDFSNKFVLLGDVPAGYRGPLTDYAALKAAGATMLGYGSFIGTVINFLLMAFIILQIVKLANCVMPRRDQASGPTEVELLTQIRDAMRERR